MIADKRARLLATLALGVLAATGIFFVAHNLKGSLDQLSGLSTLDFTLLFAGGLLAGVASAVYGLTWTSILARLLNKGSTTRAALRAFAYSWLGRYVPGTLPYHASRVLMADRIGTEKRIVAASIGYESILLISSAALVGIIGLVVSLGSEVGAGSIYLLAALPLLALPILLQPAVLRPLSTRALKMAGRQPLGDELFLGGGTNLRFFAFYTAGHVINGLGFYLVLQTLAPGNGASPALAIAVVNLAGVLGIMAFVAPGGLGVRDAVTVAFLGISMSAETALAVAAVWRGVTVLSDIGFVATFAASDLTATRLQTRHPSSAHEPLDEAVEHETVTTSGAA